MRKESLDPYWNMVGEFPISLPLRSVRYNCCTCILETRSRSSVRTMYAPYNECAGTHGSIIGCRSQSTSSFIPSSQPRDSRIHGTWRLKPSILSRCRTTEVALAGPDEFNCYTYLNLPGAGWRPFEVWERIVAKTAWSWFSSTPA
jgi:hypothetical protein